MNVLLFVLLGFSVGINVALFKTAKQLKVRLFEVEKNERTSCNEDH